MTDVLNQQLSSDVVSDGLVVYNATIISDMDLPSTNEHKLPTRRGNKVWLYKNPEVAKFQSHIESICSTTTLSNIKQISSNIDYVVELRLGFNVRNNYNRRDTSNMIKLVEDSIVKVIGIDDSKFKRIVAEKFYLPDGKESIDIRIIMQVVS